MNPDLQYPGKKPEGWDALVILALGRQRQKELHWIYQTNVSHCEIQFKKKIRWVMLEEDSQC